MKYDIELVRKLLLAGEASPKAFSPRGISVEGYDPEAIGYHCHLMLGEGLITGSRADYKGYPSSIAVMTGLTSKGHHLLEAARDKKRWRSKLGTITRRVGNLAFDAVIKQAAGEFKPGFGWLS